MAGSAVDSLCEADWKFIYLAVFQRYQRCDPKPGEPRPSRAYLEEKTRILNALMSLAYS